MEGTSRSSTGVMSSKADMPPDLLAKFEAWQTRSSLNNPLYAQEAHTYGKFEASYAGPKHARAGNFSKHFLSKKGVTKSTLDTSISRKSFY